MSPGKEASGDEVPRYSMTVDLSVLESLGINLYSNAAAVLSELVANGHDADATLVKIDWKHDAGENVVVVSDNGSGMTQAELNDRFLKVGYKKRDKEGQASPTWKRPYMGRKGIGKLSVFSIAKEVAVYTTKDGVANGLVIKVEDLEEAIRSEQPYHPPAEEVPDEYASQGTTIVLSRLKSKRANLTASALRKRLARRFDVIHQKPEADGGFYMEVNGKRIDWDDRQELKKLEFVWEFGKQQLPAEALPAEVTRFTLASDAVDAAQGWYVKGWIGTAAKPTDLTSDDEAGSLKNIIVLARGRPIQEGIIEKLDFSRLFGNYVTGQVEADFLDLDDNKFEDIATSDRQRLIEDDDRVVALQKFLRAAFVKAADEWSEHRPKKAAKDALENYPQLKDWLASLDEWQRPAAEKMIGTIASLALEKRSKGDRVALFRAGILAFERVGLRKATDDLEQLSGIVAEDLLPLLGAQGAYEDGLWIDILRSRVEAIEKFQDLTDANEKEKVLQAHLFDHLWLLDASWERAAGSEHMEKSLRKIAPDLFPEKDGEEIKGRIDIRYRTAGGQHVIVELKRYSVKPTIDELYDQGSKYYTAVDDVLTKQNKPNQPIDVVFVLGGPPVVPAAGKQTDAEHIKQRLDPINGRVVLYDELIANAISQYEEYLNARSDADRLDQLLASLESPEPEEEP